MDKVELYKTLASRFGDFLLGADPEFRLKGIKARTIVPFEGKFGADGPNSQICELRPDPKYTPDEMVRELESILRSGWRMYPEARRTKWLAGSCPERLPIGGHIHFGIKLDGGRETLLDALDKFLSPLILLLENEDEARERRRSDYGKLSFDYRGFDNKDYGFEYRGPASWLVSKQIARSVFAVAKTIGFEYMDNKSIEHSKILLSTINIDTAFKEAYRNCNKIYFKALVPTIHRALRTMKMYKVFESDINYLFALIYQGKDWSSDSDMVERWGIGKAVCLTTTTDKKLKPFSFTISNLMNPEYRWVPNNNNEFVNRFFIP